MKRLLVICSVLTLGLLATPTLADLPSRQEAINFCHVQHNAAVIRIALEKSTRSQKSEKMTAAKNKLIACLRNIRLAHQQAVREREAAKKEYDRKVRDGERRARERLLRPGMRTDEQVREAQREAEKIRNGEREAAESARREAIEGAERDFEEARRKLIDPNSSYYGVEITCENLADAHQDIISKHNQLINAVRGNAKAVAAEDARYDSELARLERVARECDKRSRLDCNQDFEARFREIQREANSPDANAETILEKLDKLKADKIACGLWHTPEPETPPTPPDAQPGDGVVMKSEKSMSAPKTTVAKINNILKDFINTKNKLNSDLSKKIAATRKLKGITAIASAIENAIGVHNQAANQLTYEQIKALQALRGVKTPPVQRRVTPRTPTGDKSSCALAIEKFIAAYKIYETKPTTEKENNVESAYDAMTATCPTKGTIVDQPGTQLCPPSTETPSMDCTSEKKASLEYYREGLGKALLNYTNTFKDLNNASLAILLNRFNEYEASRAAADNPELPSSTQQQIKMNARNTFVQAINSEMDRSSTTMTNAEDALTAAEEGTYNKSMTPPQSNSNSFSTDGPQ